LFPPFFFALTQDKQSANNYAWNAMALLSSGGANADQRIAMCTSSPANTQEETNLRLLTYIVANGALVLDRLAVPQGFLYTYPRQEVEEGIKQTFAHSNPPPPDRKFKFPTVSEPLKMMEAYKIWKQILSPDSAYFYFKEKVK
jgi:hypothetical protein